MRWFPALRRPNVTVKAHVAYFYQGDGQLGGEPHVFVKITNLSRRPIVVTHIWFEPPNSRPVHVINPGRRLPARIDPQEQFETWLPAEAVLTPWLAPGASLDDFLVDAGTVPPMFRSALFSGRVLLSNGATYTSTPNDTVPSAGFVAGPGAFPA
jgi:hypothetical protein